MPIERAHLYPNQQIGQANDYKHSNNDWPGLIVLLAADVVVYGEVGAHHRPQELGGGEEDVDVEEASNPMSWLFITQRTPGTVLCQQNLTRKRYYAVFKCPTNLIQTGKDQDGKCYRQVEGCLTILGPETL